MSSNRFASSPGRALALAGLLALSIGNAGAQPAFNIGPPSGAPAATVAQPFGMPPGNAAAPQGTAPAAPGTSPFPMGAQTAQPAAPPQPYQPPAPPSAQPPAQAQSPAAPTPFQMQPGQPAPATLAPAPAAIPAPAHAARTPDRYIVPLKRLRFEGEIDSRAWVTNVSEEEAGRAATLLVGYTNAVVVMPEASRLRVTINGQSIIETPIASSQEVTQIVAPIRAGVLRAGANLVRFEVTQRHRTDCSVASTYELWTDINNGTTGITYAGGLPALTGGLDDLPAVGVDETGATRIRVVTPGPLEGGGSARVLRAVQGIALRGRFPHPVVSVSDGAAGPTPRGTVTLVLGTAAELPRLMGSPPTEAAMQPVARFVADRRLGGPTLVVAGPTASDVDTAIERLNTLPVTARNSVATSGRFAPDAPLFTGARRVRLADLGVSTQEFSGRRFRVRFGIALPADFYATAYGQALLLIDAAYTAAVRPGSHVDVYVNDQIASTLTIGTRGGGLFQRQPLKIPLTNFRPGINRVWIEVVLDTEADARCLPGATLPGDDRFVLFDSSEFVMDGFARIGRTPDLAAFAARAFPYRIDVNPLAVVLARHDAPTVSSGATLMARLALAKGEPIAIDSSPTSSTLGERPAIFVGAIGQIAPGILGQVGIAEATRVNWVAGPGDDAAARPPGSDASYDDVLQRFRGRQKPGGDGNATPEPGRSTPDDTPEVYERWRENLSGGGGIGGILTSFEGWTKRTFGISYSSLRIGEAEQTSFEPPPRTSVLLAQGLAPNGSSTWTLVSGRTAEGLAAGMDSFTAQEVWTRIAGQAVAYQAATGTLEQRDAAQYRFVITEPLGFSNFRMVAANWLSINILPYALILVFCGIVLGTATTFLLRRLGRTA
jgi:hypothetical protein